MKTLKLLTMVAGLAILAGCATPDSRIKDNPEAFSRLTPVQQQLVRQGRVAVGFDADTVRLALGEPDRVRERTDANGQSEVWSYLTYEGDDGVILYRGFYHRHWMNPYYPYYLNYPTHRAHAHTKVIFRNGRVVSVEQELPGGTLD
jgi:hypothetical protein